VEPEAEVTHITPAEFMATSPAPLNGNTRWASRYANTLKDVFYEAAKRAPRTLQQHLGPSELGVMCDRQVAGKMAALPATNHVVDPWPSIVGTACHAWAADAFTADNRRYTFTRWLTEQRVTPHPNHPGTADLYDAVEVAVVDHKFLGESSMAKVRKDPPRKYVVQTLLYAQGYRNLGLPVNRVVLAAYPRTAGSLDGLYVWEREHTPDDEALLQVVFAQTARRQGLAEAIVRGEIGLMQVPADTGEDRDTECYFCPFYRPQASRDGQYGCPGPDKLPGRPLAFTTN
jgi:hypothetical protein